MGSEVDGRDIVLIGATGDLALGMLLPSLYHLDTDNRLADDLAIIGASRSDLTDDAFTQMVERAVREQAGEAFDAETWRRFARRLSYVAVDAETPSTFARLSRTEPGRRLYYFSVSPDLYASLACGLAETGMIEAADVVVVEKPLGRDLQSCRAINDALAQTFGEERVFRIDHYLGKETVQNLISLRFANTLLEPLWNSRTIEQVQITVAETVDVEDRLAYYDRYGALRDMVQNHLLQLLCLVAMEPPADIDPDSVRNEKVKVIRSLRPIAGAAVRDMTARGRYEGGQGAPDVETFVALCAQIDNWRWAGVPFYLRTGKKLARRRTEIVIQFREVPHSIFTGAELTANRLTIRLQPEEDISLGLMTKAPSLETQGMRLEPLALSLSLSDAYGAQRRRIAYERLLLAALKGDPTLFIRRDEAEAAWAWIDAIEAGWREAGSKPQTYPAGSWGPNSAEALLARQGHWWLD